MSENLAEERDHGVVAVKRRMRWDGEAWVQARTAGLVVHSSKFRSPETIAAAVAKKIVDHKLTDVMMIGTSLNGTSRAYIWMRPSLQVWYAEQLRFHGVHGRFPNNDAAKGGCV